MDVAHESKPWREPLLVGLFALVQGLFIHWNAFANPNRFHENWRQSPHWLADANQSFQPDDAMVAYAAFNTSPFADFLYQTLALTGHDLLWGKVNTVLFYAITAALVFLTGRTMAGRFAGLVAAGLFLFLPSNLKVFGGGFMSGLSMPLLCLALLVTHRQRWWWSVPLIVLQVLVYPMAAIHSGMLYIVDVLSHDRSRLRDRAFLTHKLLPLMIAAVLCVGFMLAKYPSDGHAYGHIVDRVEIGDRPDFSDGGRTDVLPVKSVFHKASKMWANPFHIALIVLAFLVLGRRIVGLPRGLWALLIASVVFYWLADVMLLRLYFPDRYIKRSFPLVMALAGGFWIAQMRDRLGAHTLPWSPGGTPAIPAWPVVAATLLLVGTSTFADSFVPPGTSRSKVYDRHDLYNAIKALPGSPMFVAHPRLASELQLLTGRSMLVTRELSHPWWTTWWEVVTERTEAYFEAAHDRDGDALRYAIDEHHIDYWVVDRTQYSAQGRMRKGKRRHYIEPFDSWIADDLEPSKRDLLRNVPKDRRLYDDGERYFIVSSEQLLGWLDSRAP